MNEENMEEKEEWLFDEITGMKKRTAISTLNKRKLSRYEMDELFVSE